MALELNQFLYVKGLRIRHQNMQPLWVRQLQNMSWSDYPTGDLSDISDFLPISYHPTMADTIYDSNTDTLGKRVVKRSTKCNVFLRSTLKHVDERIGLHHNSAPAFCSGETELYFLHGVHIPQDVEHLVKLQSHEIDPKVVLAIPNVDVRREFIRKIGIDQFIDNLYHKTIDRQGDYELIEVLLTDSTWSRARYLKMKNLSVGCWHVEGVPNECATVEEALLRRNKNWFAHAEYIT